jgi:hypothetical protein
MICISSFHAKLTLSPSPSYKMCITIEEELCGHHRLQSKIPNQTVRWLFVGLLVR